MINPSITYLLQIVNMDSNIHIFSVPITSVRGVLGRQAMLPCDIEPLERDDVVFMVLWYREGDNEPLYKWVSNHIISFHIFYPFNMQMEQIECLKLAQIMQNCCLNWANWTILSDRKEELKTDFDSFKVVCQNFFFFNWLEDIK